MSSPGQALRQGHEPLTQCSQLLGRQQCGDSLRLGGLQLLQLVQGAGRRASARVAHGLEIGRQLQQGQVMRQGGRIDGQALGDACVRLACGRASLN
jgi:hypothetical protein